MEYSQTKPTEPGYYWCFLPQFDPIIVYVSRKVLSDGFYVMSIGDVDSRSLDKITDDHYWAGPIAEPIALELPKTPK